MESHQLYILLFRIEIAYFMLTFFSSQNSLSYDFYTHKIYFMFFSSQDSVFWLDSILLGQHK